MAGGLAASLITALILVSYPTTRVYGFVKISPYLHACTRSSPDLDNCIKNSLTTLITKLRNGSPELSTPALDPMIIPHVESDYEDSGFRMFESFDNVFVFGLCDMKINTVRASLQQDKLEITSKISKLSFQGHFNSDAQILDYPLPSKGAFEVNLTDVTSIWIVYFKRISLNGTKYLQVEDFLSEMTPLEVTVTVSDRLYGENTLEENRLNSVLSESPAELFVRTKAKLMSVMSQILSGLTNNILKQFPEHVVLPE